uniref:G-protein coupled receptors family 2 profile 1 domain-containing protein n=1 Tax=Biomphalaria glabrata TaxID=6526 RepID=A0A2C9LB96_BIOGL
ELIQILVAAAMTQVERIVHSMTVEQREKREQAILACTKAVYDIDPNEIFCNMTIDISCWPPTRANSTVAIQCFEHDGTNPKHKARRHCSENGIWSRIDFTDCFIEDPVVDPVM